MATTKSTSRKSFKIAGPLRSIGVKTGGAGVRVALNGQEVVNVRNQAPTARATVSEERQTEQEASTLKLGRFIAEQSQQSQQETASDNENEDERGIVVGPITPIPAPRPARLGL